MTTPDNDPRIPQAVTDGRVGRSGWVRPVVLGVGVLAAGAAGWFLPTWFSSSPATVATAPATVPGSATNNVAQIGHADYKLETDDGEVFTAETLKGKPSAVFFGYTHCPDVCPTTLGDITVWQDALGPRADDLRIWFVTVDPARDNAAALHDYLSWSRGIRGVTGTPDQVAKALASFAAFARQVPGESADEYTVDHSALVMLFDRNGQFTDTIGYQEPEEQAVPKLERLLAAANP